MTNKEKAKEIGAVIWEKWKDSALTVGAEDGANLMAEWKDVQFKEYLEKKKLACVMSAKQVFGYDMGGAYDLELKAHFCDEIINELFKETEQDNSEREE